MSVRYLSHSPADTCAYGERLGRVLQGGEILLLQGDLGVGKTQLAKGIALGLGVSTEIVSPTFTLAAQYEGRLPMTHYDLYRIESMAELREVGYLEEDDRRAVRVVEWGDRAATPRGAIVITLSLQETGDREIIVVGLQPGKAT
jgi:tRNA threonylcarbamoyladenosine biosynthesis protein TsaE